MKVCVTTHADFKVVYKVKGLTEDFEHSGAVSEPGGAGGHLAYEDELVGGLDGGDGQGEVCPERDPPRQRGSLVALPFAVAEESHALPGPVLLLQGRTWGAEADGRQ